MNAGIIEWECPSNIALIKYWGKKSGQTPANPSLSFTLSNCISKVKVEYEYDPSGMLSPEYEFDNLPGLFKQKITDYLLEITPIMPFLQHLRLKISSYNTFPHSAGIASSASSFGALALAICSIKEEITGSEIDQHSFFRTASYLARLGSGSACRSVYGGYVMWGFHDKIPGSEDEAALPLQEIGPPFMSLRDSILVVSSMTKPVSSSKGHELMKTNPFGSARISQAVSNMKQILDAIRSDNLNEFFRVIEEEALTLHAMMMTSSPGYILLLPGTLEILEKIREFRSKSGLAMGFTLDAGPNVHLIYPQSVETEIKQFIADRLIQHCENNLVIHDRVGTGPVRKI